MVQRSGGANVANVEVNNTYIYYLMNSTNSANGHRHKNELTDADSIDSGTCSDNSQKTSPVPPALPKKQNSMSTKVMLNTTGPHGSGLTHEPSFSDSDESESSLSSLGSNITVNSCSDSKPHFSSLSYFPDSLLKDIRTHSMSTLNRKPAKEDAEAAKITIKLGELSTVGSQRGSLDLTRPNTFYESDKYYNFHINERDSIASEIEESLKVKTPDLDESFAGFKEIQSGSSTIRSAKGTVRGVKNRVRNGIATFLQIQQHTTKNYKEKDAGKVIVYTTSMGIVRKTFTDCANVKQILKTLLVKYEERDIFMSGYYQQELRDRLQCNEIKVPQLFVDGQYVGDVTVVENLNETGELRKLLKPYKSLEAIEMCQVCGGFRLLPCPSCGGSKKSIHRNNFTREFVALKCMNCDEVGLVRCVNC